MTKYPFIRTFKLFFKASPFRVSAVAGYVRKMVFYDNGVRSKLF